MLLIEVSTGSTKFFYGKPLLYMRNDQILVLKIFSIK